METLPLIIVLVLLAVAGYLSLIGMNGNRRG